MKSIKKQGEKIKRDERKLRSLTVHDTATKRPLYDFLYMLYYVFNNEKSNGCKFTAEKKHFKIKTFFHMNMKTICNIKNLQPYYVNKNI